MKLRLLYNFIILLFGSYIVFLFIEGKMRYYIHPRYEFFTLAGGIVAVVCAAAVIIYTAATLRKKSKKQKHEHRKKVTYAQVIKFGLLILPLVFGLLLPVKPLSSQTASQRDIDFNTLRGSELSTVDLFAADTSMYSLGEWVIALNSEPDIEDYVGKEVDVNGFIYDREELPDNIFLLSRFAITCCAVDARPVGLHVEADWQDEYEQDQWLEIKGRFKQAKIGDRVELVIIPSEINKIDVPDDPYVY